MIRFTKILYSICTKLVHIGIYIIDLGCEAMIDRKVLYIRVNLSRDTTTTMEHGIIQIKNMYELFE